MSTPTLQAAPAAPGVAPTQIAAPPPVDDVDQFQNLWDAGAFAPTDEKGKTLSAEEQAKLEREAQGQPEPTEQTGDKPAEGEQAAEGTEQPADKQAKAADAKPEDKTYGDLNEYLKDAGVEPESFMTLPVTVKVDGVEQKVPLAEVVKGYQLSNASYNRMNELATAKQQFTNEQQQVRQALGLRIQQAEELFKSAHAELLAEFNAVPWQQLRTEDPARYSAAYTDFQARNGAIQQKLQEIAQAKQAEAQAQHQALMQALPVERERLLAARPEWRDAAKLQESQSAMRALGRKLGFTDAELNRVYDHRQMLILDMAARYAALQASTPATVKRVRAAPQMAKPGTRQTRDPKVAANQAARDAWMRDPRNEDAGAAYFESLA